MDHSKKLCNPKIFLLFFGHTWHVHDKVGLYTSKKFQNQF
jgi:hypothetical protein